MCLEELRDLARDLQSKVDRFIVIRQQLIDTGGQLDRELGRFKVIQACYKRLLGADSFEEFTSTLLESILEAFEFEGAAYLRLDADAGRVEVVDQVGFEEFPTSVPSEPGWVPSEAATMLQPGHDLLVKWAEMKLAQCIICPFEDQRADRIGIILGGLTDQHKYYFDPIKAEVRTSFSVMVGQAGALLRNYELRRNVQEKNVQLEHYSRNLEDIVARRTAELRQANENLDVANQFIRKTFGRYLSEDVVETILDAPGGATLSGVKRRITLLMADLRGFTAITDCLPAESVLELINIYLGAMTDVILKYGGTIDEFLGDAIFALFGAPIEHGDAHERAVACALEMQLAMDEVNEACRLRGFPELQQGIGLNTGEVIVGNMGSLRRSKYGVVGRAVNVTSRIESHTVGGQILISRSTRDACGDILRIDGHREILAKGIPDPLEIFDVGGIRGKYEIHLPEKREDQWIELCPVLAVRFSLVEGKEVQRSEHEGKIVRVARNVAELQTSAELQEGGSIKLSLFKDQGVLVTSSLFAKVTRRPTQGSVEGEWAYRLCFTHVPTEAIGVLRGKSESKCPMIPTDSYPGASRI